MGGKEGDYILHLVVNIKKPCSAVLPSSIYYALNKNSVTDKWRGKWLTGFKIPRSQIDTHTLHIRSWYTFFSHKLL